VVRVGSGRCYCVKNSAECSDRALSEQGYANELLAPAERLIVGKIRSLSPVSYHLRLTIASADAGEATVSAEEPTEGVTVVHEFQLQHASTRAPGNAATVQVEAMLNKGREPHLKRGDMPIAHSVGIHGAAMGILFSPEAGVTLDLCSDFR